MNAPARAISTSAPNKEIQDTSPSSSAIFVTAAHASRNVPLAAQRCIQRWHVDLPGKLVGRPFHMQPLRIR